MRKWTLVLAVAALLLVGATDAQAANRGNGQGDGSCQAQGSSGMSDESPFGAMLRLMFKWNPNPMLPPGFGGHNPNGGDCSGDGSGNGGNGPRDGNGNGDGDGECDGTGTGDCDGSGPN